MGSSDKDLALRVDFNYEYKIVFGTYKNFEDGKGKKNGIASPDVDDKGKELFMTILPASYTELVPKVSKGNEIAEDGTATLSNAIGLSNKLMGMIGLATSIGMYI